MLGGDSSEHEQLSEFPWVPVQWGLQDVEGHGRGS